MLYHTESVKVWGEKCSREVLKISVHVEVITSLLKWVELSGPIVYGRLQPPCAVMETGRALKPSVPFALLLLPCSCPHLLRSSHSAAPSVRRISMLWC